MENPGAMDRFDANACHALFLRNICYVYPM